MIEFAAKIFAAISAVIYVVTILSFLYKIHKG